MLLPGGADANGRRIHADGEQGLLGSPVLPGGRAQAQPAGAQALAADRGQGLQGQLGHPGRVQGVPDLARGARAAADCQHLCAGLVSEYSLQWVQSYCPIPLPLSCPCGRPNAPTVHCHDKCQCWGFALIKRTSGTDTYESNQA